MWKNAKAPAFTLIECLVALLVLSGSLLLFDGMSRLLHQEIQQQETNLQSDWLVFANQLTTELDGSQLIKVENNKLYIQKAGQNLAFGKSKSDDFRKTNDKGQGYQPMIYHVTQATMTQSDTTTITIQLTFDTGLERSFVYAFPKNR